MDLLAKASRRGSTWLLALSLCVSGALLGSNAQAEVIFQENFANGLGGFSETGRVYTGSYGVRLRGGASETFIESPAIDVSNFTDLSIRFTREVSGLSLGQYAVASVSVDGGDFSVLELTRSASGPFSANLDNGSTLRLRFRIQASSFFDTYVVSNIVLEGTRRSGGDNGGGDNGGGQQPPPPPPPQLVDPGQGPWQVATNVATQCDLDPALLSAANRSIGTTYLIVRGGIICHEYYPSGRDSRSSVWSVTKTLGAVTVGAAMYETRNLNNSGRRTGPLQEFQRVDHWLNSISYNRDATVAHVLAMTAHSRSLAWGSKNFSYDTVGSTQINSLSDVVNLAIAQDSARLGRNIGEFYENYVAGRLGFEDSRWGTGNSSKNFAYSWSATARDMARLGLLLLNGGVWDGQRILDAQYVYNLSHAAFEDASTRYGYLTWLSEDDSCQPAPVHRSYPHGLSGATSCMRSRGCSQTHDVGVFFAAGLGGQYIIQHRGLDMVIVVKDSGSQGSSEVNRVWRAIRPAVVARDPNFSSETAFCQAYGSGNYAPNLRLWEGGL